MADEVDGTWVSALLKLLQLKPGHLEQSECGEEGQDGDFFFNKTARNHCLKMFWCNKTF